MKAKEAIAAAWRSHDEHNTDAILYLDTPTKEFFVTIPRQGWRALAEYIANLERVAETARGYRKQCCYCEDDGECSYCTGLAALGDANK